MTSEPRLIECDVYIPHPPSAVWRAITDPDLQARWFAPGDIQPIVGHRFVLDMHPWGELPCEVLAVEVERLLRYSLGGAATKSEITWRLEPEGHGTRLFLTQDGFDPESPIAKAAYERLKNGWPTVLKRIEMALTESATDN